jgi:uncharacterized membrane protein YedE/YeeE
VNGQGLHEGLVALMGTAAAASIFTIGFASLRHHHALRELRRAQRDSKHYSEDLLADEAAGLIVVGNLVLLLVVVLAALFAGLDDDVDLGFEDVVTLGGFALVEALVVSLGALDAWWVRQRAADAAAPAKPAPAAPGGNPQAPSGR